MKHLFISLLACASLTMSAYAQSSIESIGAEDFTSAWGDDIRTSGNYTITGDGAYHFKFVNTNSGTGKAWENYIFFVQDADDNSEILVARADKWSWGSACSGDVLVQPSDFVAQMNGATVNLNVYRKGTFLTIDADITTSTGNSLNHKTYGMGVTAKELRLSIKVEKAHVELLEANASTLPAAMPTPVSLKGQELGESPVIKLTPGTSVTFSCTNKNSTVNAWENLQIHANSAVDFAKTSYISKLRFDGWDETAQRNGMTGWEELIAVGGDPFSGEVFNAMMNNATIDCTIALDDNDNYTVNSVVKGSNNETYNYNMVQTITSSAVYVKILGGNKGSVTINSISYSDGQEATTSVEEVSAIDDEVVEVRYYALDGRQLAEPSGLCIKKEVKKCEKKQAKLYKE